MSTTGPDPSVLEEAQAWLAEDPDAHTRNELARLLRRAEAGEEAALADIGDRFGDRLRFGTAGLRGAMGAGPNRMNRAVVIRVSAGLAAFLRAHGHDTVVVAHDARHRSADFARDTCAVLAGAGLQALALPGPCPTPLLAFAVRELGADAGVMVTASHNPARDNGYKVYVADGAQVAPPADAEICAEIDAIGPLAAVPLADSGWQLVSADVVSSYVARAAALARPGSARAVRIVYTPLHGVGRDVMLAALAQAGFPEPVVVAEQATADPDFPTLTFPNPEEPGAMDLALAAAVETGADLVIAHDPDADRCAVAVPDPGAGTPTGWRVLSGDEVGTLLATHLLRREPGLAGVFASSIVSSSLLARIAARHGLAHVETLTGFKWIARVEGLRYGYEEALGYCVDPEAVRDKDGVSAAVLVAELAATALASGTTLVRLLDDLATEYGLHATDQLAVRLDGPTTTTAAAAMRHLRSTPPVQLGGRRVESVDDLMEGGADLPLTDALRYRLVGAARVIVRPSGTEPKLKCYLEAVQPVVAGDVASARRTAASTLRAIRADLPAAAGIR